MSRKRSLQVSNGSNGFYDMKRMLNYGGMSSVVLAEARQAPEENRKPSAMTACSTEYCLHSRAVCVVR